MISCKTQMLAENGVSYPINMFLTGVDDSVSCLTFGSKLSQSMQSPGLPDSETSIIPNSRRWYYIQSNSRLLVM